MEESRLESIGTKMIQLGDGPIKRTQSSLELLSDTALGVAKGTAMGEEQHLHGEESCSGGSGDTSASARVTPSISQVSFAGGGANISDNGTVAAEVQQEGSGTALQGANTSGSHGFIPASPYLYQSSLSNSFSDPTGLPIDHFPTYSVPHQPLAPTFLPDSYASQTHYYSHHASGQHPPGGSSLAHRPMQGDPFASHGQGTLAAAFIPPRSSTVRVPSQSELGHSPMPSGQTHYLVAIPSGMVGQAHFSNVVHHHHHGNHGPPFGPCESFQSDSTASLASELLSLNQKKPQAKQPFQLGEKQKEKREIKIGGSTLADLESENKLLRQQNTELKYELEKRNQEVSVLRGELRDLDLKVKELRQFPAGKISQIPMADMLEIMQIYGSEISDTVMPPRKLNIQKASVIRQFRRWNPNFLKHFYFKDGQWVPKLGMEGELARRQMARKKLAKGKTSNPSSPVPSEDCMSSPPNDGTPTSLSTSTCMSPMPTKMPLSDENRKRKYSGEDNSHE